MFRLVLAGLVLFLLTFSVPPASAHISGAPFLKINDKFAPANPAYFSNSNLDRTLPQDFGPEKYLVNTSITFEVDKNALAIQKELVDSATFRWSWDESVTEYAYGLKVSHTYTKIGSHLITLEIKAKDEPVFSVFNTVQVEVVDNLSYQLPTATINASAEKYQVGQPIRFQSQINSNPGVIIDDYYWFFQDRKLSQQARAVVTFTENDFFDIVFLAYKDQNGFWGYRGVWVEGLAGKINLPFPPNSREELILTEDKGNLNNLNPDKKLLFVGLILVPVVLFMTFRLRKKHR